MVSGALLTATLSIGALVQGAAAPANQTPDTQGWAQAETPLAAFEAAVVSHTLESGWTFLILPRDRAPVVSFQTYVDVGTIHEAPGATGMAHMFEHMLFKGSDRLGTTDWPKESAAIARQEEARAAYLMAADAGDTAAMAAAEAELQHWIGVAEAFVDTDAWSRVLEEAGGASSLDAWTSVEGTAYHVSLPSNQIELWAWTERERFARPALRQFYAERDTVLEERRMVLESNPWGLLQDALFRSAFETSQYRRPVDGSREDLFAYTRAEAEAFFAQHYGFGRFVTAIVGDVDPAELVPLLERYFGDLPAGPPPVEPAMDEAPQTERRDAVVHYPAEPLLALGWRVPAASAPDYPALELGLDVLAGLRTSRAALEVVRGAGLAVDVEAAAGEPGDRYPHLAVVYAVPAPNVELDAVEAALLASLRRLIATGPTDAELTAARAARRTRLMRRLATNQGSAALLSEWHSKTGDWRAVLRRSERYAELTAEDVRTALATHLRDANLTTARLVPPPASEPEKTE